MSSLMMEYLQGRGVTFVVIPHADDAPEHIGPTTFSPDDVVKTVVLVTTLGHALCVIPDDRELELELATAAVRDAEARGYRQALRGLSGGAAQRLDRDVDEGAVSRRPHRDHAAHARDRRRRGGRAASASAVDGPAAAGLSPAPPCQRARGVIR